MRVMVCPTSASGELRHRLGAAMFVHLLVAVTTFGCSAEAETRPLTASVATAFDFNGGVRFCYDREPAIVYFQHDRESNRTSVEARSIGGGTTTLFDFPGQGDPRSLSCSVDGSTIAALDSEQSHLYIFKASKLSVYQFAPRLVYTVSGMYSLLSPDGSMISAPGKPTHVSGPDVLRQMTFLEAKYGQRVFFDGGYAYIDEDRTIDTYQYIDGWSRLRSIAKPPGFGVMEMSRCGSRLVASLSNDDEVRFFSLDEQRDVHTDWLRRIGFKTLLRGFDDLAAIYGGYGRCVFSLSPKRDVRKLLLGVVTFDDRGQLRFSIEGPPLSISEYEIGLSKDGCYASLMAFKQVAKIPEFTMPQQAVVLKLAAPGCEF